MAIFLIFSVFQNSNAWRPPEYNNNIPIGRPPSFFFQNNNNNKNTQKKTNSDADFFCIFYFLFFFFKIPIPGGLRNAIIIFKLGGQTKPRVGLM